MAGVSFFWCRFSISFVVTHQVSSQRTTDNEPNLISKGWADPCTYASLIWSAVAAKLLR